MIRVETAGEFAQAAADVVAAQLRSNPHSVLALPTGSTPIGLYAELVRRVRRGAMTLAEARIFDLDEYCGLPSGDPRSFAAFVRRHLVAPLGLPEEHVRLLRGDAPDLAAECAEYERALADLGGIDLCILGLGENGHIAFNEPGSDWSSRTRIVELSESTRSRIEADPEGPRPVPVRGLTLGIQNVLEARQSLLLIAGSGKIAPKAAFVRGVQDPAWPATSLLRHRNATVIELLTEPFGPGTSR
jgi:glucosamine-6-phosphate deaminase